MMSSKSVRFSVLSSCDRLFCKWLSVALIAELIGRTITLSFCFGFCFQDVAAIFVLSQTVFKSLRSAWWITSFLTIFF